MCITSMQEGRGGFYGRAQRELVSLLKTHVVPALVPLDGTPEVDNYPWCFALVLRGRFYLGAFLDGSDTTLFALISRLSRDGALHQAALRQSLAFWQARILCLRADERPRAGESAAVQRWVQALRLSFAPAWVRWWVNQAWRFGPRSSALLTELCAADYRLGPNAGVDAVPWREWPACIAQGNHIWIWRQSRHGKYIDAQRIAITQQGSSGKNAAA
ncbi:hypothetical protein [Cronobacter malonaticus]|uniref:hypothetical protein n=1 Tax=Cronobacter malonaticus TaxID=413503 RepID=UPI001F3F4DE0|nr:hypothetical protein [Cronobacter malonaticus]WRU13358.1 hypothetical protein U9L39_14125 [Cronobacter malonaticus]